MKNTLKKFYNLIFFSLIISFIICLSGCFHESVPDFSEYEDKYLNIGAWVGPPSSNTTPEAYQDIADSGLNFIIDIYSGAINNKLEYSKQAGIKYLMNGIFFTDFTALKEYIDNPALMGIIGMDEPNVSQFEGLKEKKDAFTNLYGNDKLFFVNMLPCYATSTQLGTKYYNDYVSEFNRIIDPQVLVYDGYSLLKSSTGSTSLESGMLYNLETVAYEGINSGKPYWAFLQTMGYGGDRRNVKEEDIRFQYYTYLAYGYSGLLHFCYWTPGGAEFPEGCYAMIERNGDKTEVYYGVQKVNSEITKFDHVLLSFKWGGTMTILGENEILCRNFSRLSHPLEEHEAIETVTASENAIIGTFRNEDKNLDGFMAVNFTDPAHELSNEITITFKKSNKIMVYVDGEQQIVNLKNHTYTAEYKPGEGRFIIPL